jgi:hypothetical protein
MEISASPAHSALKSPLISPDVGRDSIPDNRPLGKKPDLWWSGRLLQIFARGHSIGDPEATVEIPWTW